MMKKIRVSVLLIIISLLFLGCNNSENNNENNNGNTGNLLENPYQKTELVMGTAVTLRIYDEGKEEVIEKAFDKLREYSDIADLRVVGSEVYEINKNAGVNPVKVSDEIFALVKKGKEYAEASDGFFDISIEPLTSLWSIGFDDARKPEQHEIDEVLPLIDYKMIELNEEEKTVFLKEEGMGIDLGAIAKGYFADLTAQLFSENGVTTAIIDLGGNLYVMGNHPTGREWTVGIQDPFSGRGQTVGRLSTSNKSIVTSGVYERVLTVDGEDYHHILSPFNGYPFMNEIAGVSIISDKSIDGDGLSTTIFAKGLNDGVKFIEKFEGVEAIFITRDKKVYVTSGLEGEFEITNDEFQLAELPAS